MKAARIRRQLTAAYHCSYIRLALNFYTAYEAAAEKKGFENDRISGLYDRFCELLDACLKGQSDCGADELRQDVIREMEKVTDYTDAFQAYEYVMNRIEGRFAPKLIGKKPEDTESLTEEILSWFQTAPDPAALRERMQVITGQLPVRFTKQKFFALLEDRLSIYKGLPRSGFEDILYILCSEGLLNRPMAREEAYGTLFDRMKAFEQADLRHLTAQEYRHLASELEEGSREINALSGEILCLMDMVNDLCVILLAQGTAVSDLSCEQNTKEILKGIQTLFASKEWEDIPEEVTDRLPALEGKQEQYFEQWLRDDISLEELQEENGPEAEAAWKAGLLMSGSAFMSLEKPNADEAEVDEVFFREKLDALFKDMGERWKELPKAVVRAAMAKCLSSLPANFQSLDEAREYIQGSLNSCSDEIEREACADLIRSLMEE